MFIQRPVEHPQTPWVNLLKGARLELVKLNFPVPVQRFIISLLTPDWTNLRRLMDRRKKNQCIIRHCNLYLITRYRDVESARLLLEVDSVLIIQDVWVLVTHLQVYLSQLTLDALCFPWIPARKRHPFHSSCMIFIWLVPEMNHLIFQLQIVRQLGVLSWAI